MRIHVISCEVMKDEFLNLNRPGTTFSFIEQGYHRTPDKMPAAIQQEIERVEKDVDCVVLGYGLCSNGIVGVRAVKRPVVVPRIHDCIAMLLGSREAYEREFSKSPGTYYLTKGWIEYGKTPYSEYKNEYLKKYDPDTAQWIAREMLKNYKRVTLIDGNLGDMERYRDFAVEMADFYGMEFTEIRGSLDFFHRLMSGRWDDDFVKIMPGEEFKSEDFLIENMIPLL